MPLRTTPRRLRRMHSHRPSLPALIDGVPAAVDLLRAEMYRMLDELARARGASHHNIVQEFESAWERYKQVTGGDL